MKRILFLTGILVLLQGFYVQAEIIECYVVQRNGDGSGGWLYVQDDKDESNPEIVIYSLTCMLPGNKSCVWSTKNGKSPCDGGKWKGIPIGDIEILDDNGIPIPVSTDVINDLICFDINVCDNSSNFFLIGTEVGVYYQLYTAPNGDLVLHTRILTGQDLIQAIYAY